jgi:hypothetical protein
MLRSTAGAIRAGRHVKSLRHATKANDKASPRAEFDVREIQCSNREVAKAEAQRQQELDNDDEAEWIYLRNKEGRWVARRTPRDIEDYAKPTGRLAALRDALIDNFHIEDLF